MANASSDGDIHPASQGAEQPRDPRQVPTDGHSHKAESTRKEPQSEMCSHDVWNVPNQISAARLLLSFVFFGLIPFKFYWAAFIVFVVAAGTDWVDGWYARRYNLVTKLGRVLDPFCDKILICGAYILLAVAMDPQFVWYAKIAGWMAVVVVGRELLVTVLRSMIEGSGGDFSAKMAGKLKMVFQCVAVGACLVALAWQPPVDLVGAEPIQQQTVQPFSDAMPTWLTLTVIGSAWLSVASTLHSGWLYVVAAKSTLLRA